MNSTTSAVASWQRIRLPRGEWFYNPNRPLGSPGGVTIFMAIDSYLPVASFIKCGVFATWYVCNL